MKNLKINFCNAQQHLSVIEFDFQQNEIIFYYKTTTPSSTANAVMGHIRGSFLQAGFVAENNKGMELFHQSKHHLFSADEKHLRHYHLAFEQALTIKMVNIVLRCFEQFQDKNRFKQRIAVQKQLAENKSYLDIVADNIFDSSSQDVNDVYRILSDRNALKVKKCFQDYVSDKKYDSSYIINNLNNNADKVTVTQHTIADLHQQNLIGAATCTDVKAMVADMPFYAKFDVTDYPLITSTVAGYWAASALVKIYHTLFKPAARITRPENSARETPARPAAHARQA